MDFNGDTASIVVDGDGAIFAVDGDSDMVHVGIADFVVCCIDQNLVKDLVKTRDNFDVPISVRSEANVAILENHDFLLRVIHPHLLGLSFCGADVLPINLSQGGESIQYQDAQERVQVG